MVIEYKIKFDEDGVTVTQTVNPGATKAGDGGGAGVTENPDHGGAGATENPDHGGAGATENPDHGGAGATENPDHGGRPPAGGRVIAVVLGPLIIGHVGPARAVKAKERSAKEITVFNQASVEEKLKAEEGGSTSA